MDPVSFRFTGKFGNIQIGQFQIKSDLISYIFQIKTR